MTYETIQKTWIRIWTAIAILLFALTAGLCLPAHADSTPVLLGDTTHPHKVLVTASSDHITGLTGQATALTTALRERKNSGSTITPGGAFTEEDATNFPGVYDYTPAAGDVNTYGEANFHTSVSGSDPVDFSFVVVAYNPYDASLLGLTGVGTAAAQTTLAGNQTTMLANQTAINTKLGTPAGASVSADIASVKVGVGTVVTVTGNVNGSLGGNVQGSVFLNVGGSVFGNVQGNVQGSVNSVATGVTLASGEHTNIVTDTTNALTAQGYTTTRAAKLDNLDVATSTRSTYAGGDTPGTTTLLNRIPQPLVFTGPNVNSAAQNLPTDYALRGVSPAWYSDYGSLIAAIKAATDKLAFDNASRVKAVLPPSAH